MNKKLKPYDKTEVAYKEILEGKKKAYDQKNAELRKQRLEKTKKKQRTKFAINRLRLKHLEKQNRNDQLSVHQVSEKFFPYCQAYVSQL